MSPGAEIIPLPRGGFLVTTSMGGVQFGIPPETIKDTMGKGVPEIFVVPRHMFSMENGVSLADLEFPIYFHYFFQNKKIQVICTSDQQRRLETLFCQALFGPEELHLEDEFVDGANTPAYPDLRAELNHFRDKAGPNGRLELSHVVSFHPFDENGRVRLGTVEVQVTEAQTYILLDQDEEVARVPSNRPLQPIRPREYSTPKVFHPPLFGVTTLGSGHGFDPNSMTSGMIIWINRRGIMVDPPVNSAIDLVERGVNPKVLDSIILTHCHADHDAGTLQKILQEGRITLYTTETIFQSFITKATALTDIPRERLIQAVRFIPLKIGVGANIHGGLFRFHYSLHSIPTIFFDVTYLGKSMVYSSDTHNNPDYIRELHEKGIMDKSRRDFLLSFPWEKDLVFHEAGVPPLHTPMECLTSLPEEVRDKTYLVHVTQEKVPRDSGLKVAPTGLAATVSLDVSPRQFGSPAELLGVYLDNPLFRSLPSEKTMEFLLIARTQGLKAGTQIYQKGDTDPHFYMVMGGQVDILNDGERVTTHGRSDYFGEDCLFPMGPREVDAVAQSDVKLIIIEKQHMETFMGTTPLARGLCPLPASQERDLRDGLEMHPVLSRLTPSQKGQLIRILKPMQAPAGEELVRQDRAVETCYLIREGTVKVTEGYWDTTELGPGELLGLRALIRNKGVADLDFTTETDTALYAIDTASLLVFLEQNPGLLLQFYHSPY